MLFSNLPSYVFHQEVRLAQFKAGEITLTDSELETLNLEVQESNLHYKARQKKRILGNESLKLQLESLYEREGQPLLCLGAYLTTDSNAPYLDSLIEKLECCADDWL